MIKKNALGVALLVAACGGDDAAVMVDAAPEDPPDALPAYDLSCESASLPTTSPDPLVLGGDVRDFSTAQAVGVEGALVEAYLTDDDSLQSSFTTAANFRYSLSIATGGNAVAHYKKITKAGMVTSYEYPPFPLWQSQPSITIWTMSEDGRDDMAELADVTLDPAKGFVGVLALDCVGVPMAGVTITSPSGTVVYHDDAGFPDPARTQTGPSGQATVWNADPGEIVIALEEYEGVTFREWPVGVYADGFTWMPRHP